MLQKSDKALLNLVLKDNSSIGSRTVTMGGTTYGHFVENGIYYTVSINQKKPAEGTIISESPLAGYRLKPLTP